jgi:hypothetical protein
MAEAEGIAYEVVGSGPPVPSSTAAGTIAGPGNRSRTASAVGCG